MQSNPPRSFAMMSVLADGTALAGGLHTDARSSRENNFDGWELGEHRSGEVVPVRTIDSLNLTACHAIKANVEGMEEAGLRRATETIMWGRPLPLYRI